MTPTQPPSASTPAPDAAMEAARKIVNLALWHSVDGLDARYSPDELVKEAATHFAPLVAECERLRKELSDEKALNDPILAELRRRCEQAERERDETRAELPKEAFASNCAILELRAQLAAATERVAALERDLAVEKQLVKTLTDAATTERPEPTNPTLWRYLRNAYEKKITFHAIGVNPRPDGGFHFYIHPQNVSGETEDYIIWPDPFNWSDMLVNIKDSPPPDVEKFKAFLAKNRAALTEGKTPTRSA